MGYVGCGGGGGQVHLGRGIESLRRNCSRVLRCVQVRIASRKAPRTPEWRFIALRLFFRADWLSVDFETILLTLCA